MQILYDRAVFEQFNYATLRQTQFLRWNIICYIKHRNTPLITTEIMIPIQNVITRWDIVL